MYYDCRYKRAIKLDGAVSPSFLFQAIYLGGIVDLLGGVLHDSPQHIFSVFLMIVRQVCTSERIVAQAHGISAHFPTIRAQAFLSRFLPVAAN